MADDDHNSRPFWRACGWCRWFRTCWQHWTRIEDAPSMEVVDDLDELRSLPRATPEPWASASEKKFVIQFQAAKKEQYINVITPAQLTPVTRSVYGTVRFADPLYRTGYHDPVKGTYTVLAFALPKTFATFANCDMWPHMDTLFMSNHWRITLVAEVALSCENAQTGLDSIGAMPRTTSGSGSE